jgi:phytoene/squalene synthetase
MTDAALHAAAAEFIRKAEARDPHLVVASLFVPEPARARFQAWMALLSELTEAIFELSDPRVTQVKVGWWAEELHGLSKGAARHPISRLLVRSEAPWSSAVAPLLALASNDETASDASAALAALMPLARALCVIEAALLGGHAGSEGAAQGMAIQWLAIRLNRGRTAADGARIPMAFFARHGVRSEQLADDAAEPLLRDWAGHLASLVPNAEKNWAYPRTLSASATRRALRARTKGKDLQVSGLPAVWMCWQAARHSVLPRAVLPART